MVERYTLSNGIPLFVVENHASPVVSVQAWVRRGSAYETERLAGISHFLEHALFKGTRRRKVGEIALEIESRGGEINAFTSFEETAYYTTLASRYFEDGLDVICDAIQNPSFDKLEIEREREVILEEIKRAHDSPHKTVSTNLWKTSFENTPYGRPVLGFEETVRKIDHKVLREYFSKNYHAATTSLFIVGDVDKKEAAAMAKKMLAKMKRGKDRGLDGKIKLAGSRNVKVVSAARDIKECHLQLAVLAPSITSGAIPAMDLACSAIGQGESSRLYQRLVKETQLALDVHMGLVATGHCGLATIAMAVAPENMEPALAEVSRVISDVMAKGITESEIERVKSSLEAEVVGGKETVEGYARRLGYYYVQFGDPNYEKRYLDAVLSVDGEQAVGSLRTLFAQKAPVLSVVHPMEYKVDKKKISAAVDLKAPAKTVAPKTGTGPEKVTVGNVPVVLKSVNSLPIITLRFIFSGGSRDEQESQLGIASLFQRTWTSGTKSFNSLQIAHTLESLGASLYGFSGKNTSGLSLEFLSKQWPTIKPLLNEVLLAPMFPETEVQTEKSLMLREIMAERDAPGQVCHLNFMHALYGNHPYGRSSLGTKETVSGLTKEHLMSFYRGQIQQGRLVVSTVGNFAKSSWQKELEDLIKALPMGSTSPRKNPAIPEQKGLRVRVEAKKPLFQSHVMAGFLGATVREPERYALKLLSSCLAGQGGRLFLELRDKQSLAYTVSPIISDGPERGLFAFYIGCSPEKLSKSLSGIRTEIDKILQGPMPAKELARAKEYWIGRFELDMQRFASQAMLFGLDEAYGLGYDQSLKVADIIKKITANDILEAARKYLLVDSATISVVHNEKIGEEQIVGAWSGK